MIATAAACVPKLPFRCGRPFVLYTAHSRAYFFLPARCARAALLAAAAARMSCLKAASSIFSPSRRSIARRVLPSRLELKSFFGSGIEAPRAKVSFTACLYDSPVQTMPSWDQMGTPDGLDGFTHLHSSTMPGSASWMSCRICARISLLQSPRSSIRLVMFAELVMFARAAATFLRFVGFKFSPILGFPSRPHAGRDSPQRWPAVDLYRSTRALFE